MIRSVDGKYLMRFRSETSGFKFLWRSVMSVDGAKVEIQLLHYASVRPMVQFVGVVVVVVVVVIVIVIVYYYTYQSNKLLSVRFRLFSRPFSCSAKRAS